MSSSLPQFHSEIENQPYSPATTMDASFASSSTSTSTSFTDLINGRRGNYGYDVFINHRGPDTKKTFASHLYRRLILHGLRAFLDQQELQEGLKFPSQIEDAISSASVHVAIFSPRYAESEWCLEELVRMQDSKALIVPVFFHVKPAELRRTMNKNGVYAKALREHQMKKTEDSQTHQEKPRYDSTTIQNWRNALSSVADISGFDLEAYNGDEGLMVDKVVELVLKMVKKTGLYVAKHPSGLQDKVKDFETVLRQHQHSGTVQVVGIVGLGGVGKTTLALELFNRKRSQYNKSYFLCDVRENAKSSLHSLQCKLFKGLIQLDLHIDNIYEGIEMLRKYLSSSQVLLILDDIDHEDQLDALLPVKDVLRSDSLILITCRDKDILARSGVEELSIFKLTGLNRQHSLELFCSYAFGQSYPLEGFENMVDKFLMVCGGLPLSLKVFGTLLFGKNDKSYWEHRLYQVKIPTDIHKTLKISYDALSEEERQIFLDIACFFIGQKRDKVIRIWDESGWKGLLGIQNLESKCLVEMDSRNRIHMHDHLRDLGREIAEASWPRRFWRPTENIDDLLQRSSVITEVRGIRMVSNEIIEKVSSDILDRPERRQMLSCYGRSRELLGSRVMKLGNRVHSRRYHFLGIGVMNLQLLETEGHLLERTLRKVHSPNLIWLSWRDCPYSYLPSWIPMKNIRVLEVSGSALETLWQGKSQAPLQLRELEIDAPLSIIPKSIGQLKHLERIVIHFSSGYVNLKKLPQEFCHLKSLKILVLRWCSKLKSLPDSFGNLTSLRHMELSRCQILERLPDSFSNLVNLQHIKLSECQNLERLPDSFGDLRNLQHIDLSWCQNLQKLPDSFGNLRNLQHINLFWCQNLQRLPNTFGNLSNLQYLVLSGCQILESLPDSFGSLISLKYLGLFRCSNLTISSDTFGNISTLQHIDLSDCEKIEVWPSQLAHQRSLKELKLTGTKIKELPAAMGDLKDLEVLELGSPSLDKLPLSLGDLRNLKELTLKDCRKLKFLPVGLSSQLTKLTVVSCPLVELAFRKVKGERETSRALRSLDSSLDNCMPRLQYLLLQDDSEISEVSFDEGVCLNLQHFILKRCSNLVEVGTLPGTLLQVELHGCYNLGKIELCGLAKLQTLNIIMCKELQALPGIKILVSLEEMKVFHCVKLKVIQDLARLTKLKLLHVEGCLDLKELESVEHCISLVTLNALGCPKLQLGEREVEKLLQQKTIMRMQ